MHAALRANCLKISVRLSSIIFADGLLVYRSVVHGCRLFASTRESSFSNSSFFNRLVLAVCAALRYAIVGTLCFTENPSRITYGSQRSVPGEKLQFLKKTRDGSNATTQDSRWDSVYLVRFGWRTRAIDRSSSWKKRIAFANEKDSSCNPSTRECKCADDTNYPRYDSRNDRKMRYDASVVRFLSTKIIAS